MKTIAEQLKTPTGGFDALRLVLALSVILHHSFALGEGHKYLVADPPWYRVIAGLAVPMFFGLSGFLVAKSADKHPPLVYAAYRALRILPALLVVLTISVFLVGPFVSQVANLHDYFASPVPWAHYLILFGFRLDFFIGFHGHHEPNFNGALWTIPWEMFCYGVLGLVAVAGGFRRKWILLAVAAASFWFIPWLLLTGQPLGYSKAPYMLSCFAVGSLLYAFRDHVRLNLAAAAVAFALACGLLAAGWMALSSIPMAVAAVGFGLRPIKPIHTDLSYGVYICAFPFQNIISATSWGEIWWINAPVSAAFALAYASLSWQFVEEPALRLKGRMASFNVKRFGDSHVEAAVGS